jgi:hypothetical protein
MKEAPGSSETSVLTRATRRNNPEDTFLYIVSIQVARTHIKLRNVLLASVSTRSPQGGVLARESIQDRSHSKPANFLCSGECSGESSDTIIAFHFRRDVKGINYEPAGKRERTKG